MSALSEDKVNHHGILPRVAAQTRSQVDEQQEGAPTREHEEEKTAFGVALCGASFWEASTDYC